VRSSRRVLGVGNAFASELAIMCLVSEEANVGTDKVVSYSVPGYTSSRSCGSLVH
jgi:hypothetical protein